MRNFISYLCIISLILTLTPISYGQIQVAHYGTTGPTKGSLICTKVPGTDCGTTKADWVGAFKLNTVCDKGFYDMIYGGTCWSCPKDTDNKGDWIRSATAVTKDDACWRIPKESTGPAINVRKEKTLAWDCPSGSFWDGYNWGSCWKCPDALPRRTAHAVHSNKACATSVNETKPAIFLKFNGCPKPDAQTMKLTGKRLPGKPFLDIAGGWNEGVASGGCYACPVMDEDGHILITERNTKPIYGNNQGCDILLKWKPGNFQEPGLQGLAGAREFIIGTNLLLSSEALSWRLYTLAEARGLGNNTPQAKEWVTKQWQEIATSPYRNDALRAMMFDELLSAAVKPNRTPAEAKFIAAFEENIRQRRIFLAQTGLDMYDAWKAYNDRNGAAKSQLMVAFDYGTVPLDFHNTLSAVAAVGATGAGVAGTLASAASFANQVKFVSDVDDFGKVIWSTSRQTVLFGLSGKAGGDALKVGQALKPLNLLKGVAAANIALVGVTIITVVFAIIQTVAIDQFIEIISARPKLEAALATANNRITVNEILAQPNGTDLLLYYWAKAMENNTVLPDEGLTRAASAAHQAAQASGYKKPEPKL